MSENHNTSENHALRPGPKTPKQRVDLSRSEFAENFLYLNGKPFSLDDYPFMRRIYDSGARKIVMKTSRQVSKSTTLANMMLANASMIPYLRQLYISPAVLQTQEFARDKLEPVINQSPLFRKYYVSPDLIQNVYKKEFLNGSVINLRYALLTADRIRGISADFLFADECQDLLPDVLAVTEETMSRSMYKYSVYAGTPKRTKGTLASLWQNSTQSEYAIKSPHSGHWNILSEENIGTHGLIDAKSGMPLNPLTDKGEWVSTHSLLQKPAIEGFRVCLLHFTGAPWVSWERDVLYKYENHSKALFHNETLGLEYDSGSAPISKEELIQACNQDIKLASAPEGITVGRQTMIGIDYGPVNSENSHTVITVLQEHGGYLQVVYAKKYVGQEASFEHIHKEIPKLVETWGATHLAADYGMGEASNSEFRAKLGFDKVLAFQYLPTQKEMARWQPKMLAHTLNKSQALNKLFSGIKKGKIRFPRWQDSAPFLEDILQLVIEYDEERNTSKYSNLGPDDFTHSTLFAVIAAMGMWDLQYLKDA
jgi:hypothetical protein